MLDSRKLLARGLRRLVQQRFLVLRDKVVVPAHHA
jgi:hypothetical protein